MSFWGRIEMEKIRHLETFFRMTTILVLLLIVQGCQNGEFGAGPSDGSFISGKVPPSSGSVVVITNQKGETQEVTLNGDGSFFARVQPGTYQLFLKTSTGKLDLIKKSVVLEDNMTVNLLDVSLIPFPQVTSVAVPVVYSDSVVIEWETDLDSDGRIDYGTDVSYEYSTFTDSEMKKKHRIQLYNLNPGTAYHFRVAVSRYGLESVQTFSNDYVFKTEAAKE